MPKVLSLVTFSIEPRYRQEFIDRAREQLKAYWESHGSLGYEVYEEMGPAGPTGRLVEVNLLESREAYQEMTRHVRTTRDLPEIAYRHVRDPHFQVMECRT